MKTLNPQLLFQRAHFFDERWCYDSEGLQGKAPQRGSKQEEAEDKEMSTTPSV